MYVESFVTEDLRIHSFSSTPYVTYSPPALDQMLPMQRYCDGTLFRHLAGMSLCTPLVRVSWLQVVFCAHACSHTVRSPGKETQDAADGHNGACVAVRASSSCRGTC